MMRRIILAALLIVGFANMSYAQKKYNNIQYPKLDNIKEPNVKTFKTDNGVTFYMVEDHELPLINVHVLLRAGGVMVPDKKTGLASLTGTVMRSGGSKSISGDSLNTLLEDKAASMETGIGFTSGSANMNVLTENFDDLLPVFVDLLTQPAFPKDKIELAEKHAKSAISRRNDNIDQIGSRVFDQVIYGKNSIYARNTEYATINNIDRGDMVKFHKNNFTGKNMMIGVEGDFDANAMKAKLKKAFGDIPAGTKNKLDFPKVNYHYKHTINFVNKPDVDQSLVLMGHIGGMRDNPDYANIQVMNKVLSGGFSGRLMQQIRTNLGLAYGVGGRFVMSSFYPGPFVLQVKTKSSTTAEAIDAIIKEVKKLQNQKISEKELHDAQSQILNSAVFHHDSYSKILNERISNDYRGLPDDAYQQYLKGVRNTSIADVQHVAQKYLHPNKLQMLVVGNKKELGDQLQKYGNINTIDVSIPQPGGNKPKKMVQGDAQKGKQLLSKMANAIISSGTSVNSLLFSGKATVQGRQLPVSITINYPKSLEETITMGSRKLKMSLDSGDVTISMAGHTQLVSASSPRAKNLQNALNFNLVTLAKNADNLNPQFTGIKKVNGATYNKVDVQIKGDNLTLLLDQKTNQPTMAHYQQFNPQQGKKVTVTMKYSNWASNDGVTYPHNIITLVNGQKQEVDNFDSHKVNPKK